jgi:adenylate kinase
MNLIIFGPPGSGKGTYATRLKSQLGVATIAMGDIFRELAKEKTSLAEEVNSFLQQGKLVPDEIVINVLKKRLEKHAVEGVILDGYPRTLAQANALDNLVTLTAIIHLVVPDWIIIERLSSRRICSKCGEVYNIRFLKPRQSETCDKCGGKLLQRADDTPDVIKERVKIYEKQTQPLLQYYKKRIPIVTGKCDSVDTPPEVVVASILKSLKTLNLA